MTLMPALIELLPDELDLVGLAGSPFAVTVTVAATDAEDDPIAWADFTGWEVTAYDANVEVEGYAPEVTSPVEGVLSIVWTVEQTALMERSTLTWQLSASIDGDGPYGFVAGDVSFVVAGTPGASTSSAANLAVEVGTASVALTVTVGGTGGGSGGIDGGTFSSEYGGTTGIDGGEF